MSYERRGQDGITLLEVIISVVILSMIAGALTSAFLSAINISRSTSQRVVESNDSQVIAGFLVRDAQASGGSNPTTGGSDLSLGVSAAPGADDGGCTNAYSSLTAYNIGDTVSYLGSSYLAILASTNKTPSTNPTDWAVMTLELRFKWNDQTGIDPVTHNLTNVPHVANYSFASSTKQLVRTSCVGAASPTNITMGSSLVTVVPSCSPSGTPPATCPPHPDTVSLTITESNSPVNNGTYTYTLTASLRPESQTVPCDDTSLPGCTTVTGNPVTFMATGGVGCTNGTTGLDVGGNPGVTIYGQVVVNTPDQPGCPAMFLHGAYQYSSGPISLLNGGTCPSCAPGSTATYTVPFGDPYASTLGPLAASCGSGSNPAPVGGTYTPAAGVPLVFPQLLAVGNIHFNAGTYVFCHGITAGTITTPAPPNPGVIFDIVSGGFTQAGGANTTINGLVYAPTSIVDISGNGFFHATAVVAGALVDQGTPSVVIGTAPAVNIAITGPATLPNWTAGVPYPNTTMTATGGGGIYSWSATGLPAGLSIDAASGKISGTPTAAAVGTSAVQITVTDSLGDNDTNPYTIVINAAPAITGPATLTDWTFNRTYPNTAIVASGGTTPYAWTASGLPTGLSINGSTGVVSGTPTATGTFPATVTLTDASGAFDTQGYTIKINAAPLITGPNSLPDWTVNRAYPNQTMTNSNGTAPFTWAASGLPTGLGINSGTGVISGTPNAAGTFAVSVTVTDKAGASKTANYSVKINPAPGIATASLPTAEVGRPYNFTLTPTAGGTPPYTWSLPTHPAWLSINAATGTLTGTPPATGTPAVTAKVTDAAGASAQTNYSLTIAAAVQISGPASLPNWTINRTYPGTAIVGTGGVTPFTWSATGLPTGLTIDAATGVISGKPTATGTFSIVVTVLDAVGGTDTQSYTVTINPVPTISTASPLPDGEQSVPYSKSVTATNGTPPYSSWTASGLPNGLSINAASGVLSGTPTVSGTFSVTVSTMDAAGASASKILTLTLNTTPTGSGTLPNWTVNKVYPNPQISGSGGAGPYTFTATNLPTGLTIGLSTGIVSGTPTATGTKTAVITVHDSLGGTAAQNYTVTINAAPAITTASPLPPGTSGAVYSGVTIAATGGTTPFNWTATGLPSGLSIAPGTGAISGTPTVSGTFSVVVSLSDAAGATANHPAYSLTIGPAPSITSVQLVNNGTAGLLEKGDQIVVVFSTQMKENSICSTWGTDDTVSQSLSVNGNVVTVTDGGAGSDSLTVGATVCTFNFGSINLGSPSYVSGGNATFGTNGGGNRSTYTWNAGSNTLTITLGTRAGSGTPGSVASSTPIYSASGITDPAGTAVTNSPFTLPSGVQF